MTERTESNESDQIFLQILAFPENRKLNLLQIRSMIPVQLSTTNSSQLFQHSAWHTIKMVNKKEMFAHMNMKKKTNNMNWADMLLSAWSHLVIYF